MCACGRVFAHCMMLQAPHADGWRHTGSQGAPHTQHHAALHPAAMFLWFLICVSYMCVLAATIALCRRPMRLGGGLGGDTRAAKEPRKKLMAEAAARGTTLPPAEAPIRYSGCCSACGRAGAGLAGAGLTLLRYSTGAEQLQIQCGVCSCCGLHVAQLFWVCRSVQVLGCGWL